MPFFQIRVEHFAFFFDRPILEAKSEKIVENKNFEKCAKTRIPKGGSPRGPLTYFQNMFFFVKKIFFFSVSGYCKSLASCGLAKWTEQVCAARLHL